MMELTQNKLDVTQKKRSNIFNWRGQFTPEFVEYIIDTIELNENSVIADPFVGSGTVLIEAFKENYPSIGFEINPAAYHMAKFYEYANLTLSERQSFVFKVTEKIQTVTSNLNGQLVYTTSDSYRNSYREFIKISKKLSELSDNDDQSFIMNVLFASEKNKKMTIKESLYKSLSFFENTLFNLPFNNCSIQVHNLDARLIGKLYLEKVDLIITSPPYINVFNYHQNHRAVTEAFDYNILGVAHSEFGSNRKNRGNRLLTVVQYVMDMEQSLESFWNCLKPKGKMVLVLGKESNVRKTPFYNGQIIKELILEMGCFSIISESNRAFQNKFGKNIIEDILIVQKNNETRPNTGFAKKIASKHLAKARNFAPKDVLIDFDDVMLKLNNVKHSPIFK
jgi:DNA modification methylase